MSAQTIDGVEYDRVYVCELEPGDVNPFDEVVRRVTRISDTRTIVELEDGRTLRFGHAGSTMLVRSQA